MNRRAFLSVLMGLPLLGPLLRLTKTAPKEVKVADGTVWFDKPHAKGQEMTFRYNTGATFNCRCVSSAGFRSGMLP